jgi:hypothetical protein
VVELVAGAVAVVDEQPAHVAGLEAAAKPAIEAERVPGRHDRGRLGTLDAEQPAEGGNRAQEHGRALHVGELGGEIALGEQAAEVTLGGAGGRAQWRVQVDVDGRDRGEIEIAHRFSTARTHRFSTARNGGGTPRRGPVR